MGKVTSDQDPMPWLMPIGLVLGLLVVCLFERLTNSWRVSDKIDLYNILAGKPKGSALANSVEEKLRTHVNGLENIGHFWGGIALDHVSREHILKVYEMLALVCALMLSICVSFYTADQRWDHIYGLVCCIANCALWMATLSSAFFVITIGACESDEQVTLLVGMYGVYLMRAPMMLFIWGTTMLFLEFVLYFKITVDAGFTCVMCLTSCLLLVPLFFHCMHKLGWAARVVQAHNEVEKKNARPLTTIEIQNELCNYIGRKGNNFMELDYKEFLRLFDEPGIKKTSTQVAYAKQIFDAHVQQKLKGV